MQSCFYLDLALKLKGINIAMGEGGEGALRLLFRFGNRVLAGRGENSTECLNLFATACLIVLPQYCWMAYFFLGSKPCIYISFIVTFQDNFG